MSADTSPQAEDVRRPAAVLMLISADPPHEVVFVQRASHLRNHPGQIAFPGGAVDPEDGGDRLQTALREVREELGVSADRIAVIARLPDVTPTSGRFLIAYFVGVLTEHTRLAIDPAETAAVWNVPLAAILEPGAIHQAVETRSDGSSVLTNVFDYEGMHVWGATGQMLVHFVEEWNAPDSALRRGFEAAVSAQQAGRDVHGDGDDGDVVRER